MRRSRGSWGLLLAPLRVLVIVLRAVAVIAVLDLLGAIAGAARELDDVPARRWQ